MTCGQSAAGMHHGQAAFGQWRRHIRQPLPQVPGRLPQRGVGCADHNTQQCRFADTGLAGHHAQWRPVPYQPAPQLLQLLRPAMEEPAADLAVHSLCGPGPAHEMPGSNASSNSAASPAATSARASLTCPGPAGIGEEFQMIDVGVQRSVAGMDLLRVAAPRLLPH